MAETSNSNGSHAEPPPQVRELVGEEVVLDVASTFVFIGTLKRVGHDWLVLVEADVHDLRDTQTTREKYLLACREHGISRNRTSVWVAMREVVGISRLSDIVA